MCLIACLGIVIVLLLMFVVIGLEERKDTSLDTETSILIHEDPSRSVLQRLSSQALSPLEQITRPREVVTIKGQIYNQEIRNHNHVIYLKALRLSDETIIPESRVIIYVDQENVGFDVLRIGDHIEVSGTLYHFEGRRNPGNFDQRRFFHKQGIHGSMFVEHVEVLCSGFHSELDSHSTLAGKLARNCERVYNDLRTGLNRLKYSWIDLLFTNLGEEHGGLMSSILLGEKSAPSAEMKRMFQKNGIGHILVISGLHMSFLGVGLYSILRKCGLSFVAAGLIGLLFLMVYTLMIGIGVSSFRALLMFAIRMGAEIWGRRYDGANSLAIALMAFLLWRPTHINEPGFLLSFGAVLSIVMVMPVLTKYFVKRKEKRWVKTIKKAFFLNLSINLMILPIIATFFFEFPMYTVFINMLVVPLMVFLLGAGLIGSLLYVMIPILGQGVFLVCRGILWFYEGLCQLFIRLPGSRIITGQPEMWQVMLYYGLFLVLYLFLRHVVELEERNIEVDADKDEGRDEGRDEEENKRGLKSISEGICKEAGKSKRIKRNASEVIYEDKSTKREVKVVVSLALLLFMFLSLFPLKTLSNELTITMIDVGQGDGVFIRDPYGGTYLIDGGSSNVSAVGLFRMEPFLLSQGIRKIDYVLLSHGDDDHFSGIIEMMENQRLGIKIETLVLPGREPHGENVLEELARVALENNIRVVTIEKGQQIVNGELEIRCLAPAPNLVSRNRNDYSMVLSLNYRHFSMLFTGDIEEAGERALLINEVLSHHTVLKVSHHGSRTSSAEFFLEQVHPQIALISAGQNNRFNHPSSEVVERIESYGAEIFVTNEVGAITVRTDGNKVRIRPYLNTKRID